MRGQREMPGWHGNAVKLSARVQNAHECYPPKVAKHKPLLQFCFILNNYFLLERLDLLCAHRDVAVFFLLVQKFKKAYEKYPFPVTPLPVSELREMCRQNGTDITMATSPPDCCEM